MHTADSLLDVAADLTAAEGAAAVTMSAVAASAGAPSGSVYYRFPDRAMLLASLWLRTVERFQSGFSAALRTEPPQQAAVNAAHHVIEWSRNNPLALLIVELPYAAVRRIARDPDSGTDPGATAEAVDRVVRDAMYMRSR